MNRKTLPGLLLGLFLLSAATAQAGEAVIIKCGSNCDAAAADVLAAGGSITYRYKYVDAIAANLPADVFDRGNSLQGVERMVKDVVIEAPQAVEHLDAASDDVVPGDAAALEVNPLDFAESTTLTGVGALFAAGHTGDGAVVAVIDSGTAPVSSFNRAGCPTPGPTVLGGETYIAGAAPGEPSATSTLNSNHGTAVGTTIAANAMVGFLADSPFGWGAPNLPSAIFVEDYFPGVDVYFIPMIGTAPCAQLYALKTFPASGAGAPRSDIAAAMERAIELRENYNNGMSPEPVSGSGTAADPYVYDALKIDVVNMSLGGPSTYAGYEITDLLTLEMLKVGITVVNSAGNDGPAAMTGGSAGTSFGTLTAGAASLVHNERFLRDAQFGPGIGLLYRPSEHHQMATFSARGPSPDGRVSVDAIANGFANFAQNASGSYTVISGTSFSAPTISGAAAVLHAALPGTSGLQVRNALVETADPTVLGDGATWFDQGRGFINAAAAYQALVDGRVSNFLPFGIQSNSVRLNIALLGVWSLTPHHWGIHRTVRDLVPGQVRQFFINTTTETEALIIRISDLMPELPPAEQNAFFGDDLYVVVQDAITSTEGTLASAFVKEDTTLVADRPQSGLVRVVLMGDWTNAGRISAKLEIEEVKSKRLRSAARGRVREGDSRWYSVKVPADASQANFELQWRQDWGRYPTDDLDLTILPPGGDPIFDGATLNSPERVVIDDPVPGEYLIIVDGYTVWGRRGNQARFSLHAYDDKGKNLKTREL